jgi:hypothetical protein
MDDENYEQATDIPDVTEWLEDDDEEAPLFI